MKKFFKQIFTLIIVIGILCVAGYIAYLNRASFLPSYTISFCSENETLEEYERKITKYDSLTLPEISREGYDFNGWYFGETKWNDSTRVTKEMELVAKWTAKDIEITYIVDGVEHTQIEKYDSMPEFKGETNLDNTETEQFIFNGWQPALSKIKGPATYTAQYISMSSNPENTRSVVFIVDDTPLLQDIIQANVNSNISAPTIDSSKYGMNGYTIDGWYTDYACSTRFTFPTTLTENLELYGKWEYMLGNGFYDSLSKFQTANTTSSIEIASYEELVAYVEYVEFYDIQKENLIKLTYKNLTGNSLMNELKSAIEDSVYPSNSTISYATKGGTSIASIHISKSNRNAELSLLNADENKSQTHPQQEYAYAVKTTPTRANNFDNFNLNQVKNSLTVSTSNQLVYALEKGLNPICETGSKAETIFNKAKAVLREICTDDMTNIQKAQAIYEWLILNVQYDNKAVNTTSIMNEWQKYDAWYAEGVFLNGKAVCDGIAKAYLILAQIENIPTIRVSGDTHAWNKIYINDAWYGVDATHGNLIIDNQYETLSYTNFLFTDAYKTSQGYTADNYSSLIANTVFNYYDYADYSLNSTTFDLFVESKTEFVYILTNIKTYSSVSTYHTIEISIGFNISIQELINYGRMATSVNIQFCSGAMTDSNGNTIYCLFI